MHGELSGLIETYNDAVDRYNLARLGYAVEHEGLEVPPVAYAMPAECIERADAHRPASAAVQSVRDFFEDVFDGAVPAATGTPAYDGLHEASLELTRQFFRVSLTRMGISCRGMLD